MLTLIGSFLGFFSSIFPEILKSFQDRHDREHELAMFDRQIKLLRQGHDLRMHELEESARIMETQALYQHAAPTNVRWVDALSGTVRPILTYAFFFLYAAIKACQWMVIMTVMDQLNWAEAMIRIWHDEDQALFAAVMSFWFGQRTLKHFRR